MIMFTKAGRSRPECDCRHECCCRRISYRTTPRPSYFHTPRNSTEGQPVRRKESAPIRTFVRKPD